MEPQELLGDDFAKPVYLHYNHDKFWEIKAGDDIGMAYIRCGKLKPDGTEVQTAIQTVEKMYSSKNELMKSAQKLIGIKLSKGYQAYEKKPEPVDRVEEEVAENDEELNDSRTLKLRRKAEKPLEEMVLKQVKKSETQDLSIDPKPTEEIKSPKPKALGNFLNFLTERKFDISNLENVDKFKLLEKSVELELDCTFEDKFVVVKGYQNKTEEFEAFLKQQPKKSATKETTKELKISAKLSRMGSEIERKGLELGLICEIRSDKVVVLASEGDIEKKMEDFKLFLDSKEPKDEESGKKTNGKMEEEEKKKDSDKKEESDKYVNKEYVLTENQKKQKGVIGKEAESLGVFHEFTDTKMYVLGSEKSQEKLRKFLFGLDKPSGKKSPDFAEPGAVSTEIILNTNIRKCLEEIKKKASELNIVAFEDDKTLFLSGIPKKIDEITAFINEKDKAEAQKVASALKIPDFKLSLGGDGKGDDFVQKEISISTFHRSRKDELTKKANELDLVADFGYDVVLVAGTSANIGKFVLVLYETEAEAKKSLYPKNWDFHETRPFSKLQLSDKCEEYKTISDMLLTTMNRPLEVVTIERIQNKYLMEHYINNIQKRMETRPNENINRHLLFHGTRTIHPETIYKSFDTGFDLQYANHGSYGKGLYFARNASYSCNGYQFTLPNGNCLMLVADVFVGRHVKNMESNGLKAQQGADSVFNGEFYIIYNNFHSYPLYLIEYKDSNRYGGGGMGGMGGGLFANRTVPAYTGGGLFGGNTGGGLFGGGGGLFGNNYNTGGGLFGNNNYNTGGGLLGNNYNNGYYNNNARYGNGINNYDDEDDEEDEDWDGEDPDDDEDRDSYDDDPDEY